MSGSGGILANGGGLEALLKAAKFVEEQEKQKLRRQSAVHRASEDGSATEGKELMIVAVPNGLHSIAPSSRIPTPPLPRHGSVIREVHNKLEKNRRAHLKECFETLKKQLPPTPEEKKTSNLSILHNAIRYIAILKRKEREFEHEMERLAREKIAAQQRLATLKKELTAQWEHIDLATLLPDVVEPEPPRRASDMMNSRSMCDAGTGSDEEVAAAAARTGGTLYSSTSSLSSASPSPHTHTDPHPYTHSHHAQVVSMSAGGGVVPSLAAGQLLPSTTTIRMLPVPVPVPADTHFVHSHVPTSGITIQNGLLNHNTVTLASKHAVSSDSSGVVGLPPHFLLATSPSPSPSAATTHIAADKVLVPQFLVKPTATMVVVSATNTHN